MPPLIFYRIVITVALVAVAAVADEALAACCLGGAFCEEAVVEPLVEPFDELQFPLEASDHLLLPGELGVALPELRRQEHVLVLGGRASGVDPPLFLCGFHLTHSRAWRSRRPEACSRAQRLRW